MMEPDPPRFVVDSMLGKLARWLRAIGYDTDYDRLAPDDSLLRQAEQEGRVLLTRDTQLLERRTQARTLFVRSDHPEEQFAQVRREIPLRLDPRRFLSRCLECNGWVRAASRDEVWADVPPFIYLTQHRFRRCQDCRRVFWAGTHLERIQRKLERLGGVSSEQ